jgi:hypothetical protein
LASPEGPETQMTEADKRKQVMNDLKAKDTDVFRDRILEEHRLEQDLSRQQRNYVGDTKKDTTLHPQGAPGNQSMFRSEPRLKKDLRKIER